MTDLTSISFRAAGARISAESLRLVTISGAHHHYGTVRLAQNVLQGRRARGFPYSSPGKDDEVRGLSFGQAQHLRGCSAMGEEHPHVDVVKRAKARDTIDKLAGPSWPFVLWLIDVTWCGERASLRRSSPDIRYVDHQKFSATTFGKLCRRLECGAGGGCSIVRHHDMVKMPRCCTALRRHQHHRTRSIVQHFHRRAAQHLPPLGAAVLAHDDQSRLYFSRGLQNFHRRRSNAGVDGQAVQQRSFASEFDCAVPLLPARGRRCTRCGGPLARSRRAPLPPAAPPALASSRQAGRG